MAKKEIISIIQNNWKAFFVGCILATSIFLFLLNINVVSWSWTDNSASISDSFKKLENNSLFVEKEIFCEGGSFSEKIEDWSIKHYRRPDKDGFYCVSPFSPFLSPDIWYKKNISTNFDSLKIRFKLKNAKDETDILPTLIFSIGKDVRILRLYFAEKSSQVVGFEKISIGNEEQELVRGEVKTLSAPMNYDSDIELEIRNIVNAKNKITFYFNLRYLSDLTGESIEDSFSYEVDLPDPFIESELSVLEFGFGVFKKSCIKPISYKFCY